MNSRLGLEVVPLHNFPELEEDCMKILNHQWPRSEALRSRSFNLSCDELPTSLILRGKVNGKSLVLGHSRINAVPNKHHSLWIGSVVIHHEFRGKGLGRFLMEETEKYSFSLGYKCCFLSTHDQQDFYLKLGYKFCPPVSLYGGTINKNILSNKFISSINIQENGQGLGKNCNLKELNAANNSNSLGSSVNYISPPPPPPPPPPPALSSVKNRLLKSDIQRIDGVKQFMEKQIAPLSIQNTNGTL